MAEPIEANYVPDGEDWTITVTGRGKQLTTKAPGIIAARDRVDQLVEEVAPDEEHRTVVHTLNGDAVQFTTAYLTARLAKSEPVAAAAEPDKAQGGDAEAKADKKSAKTGKASANGVERSARPGQSDQPNSPAAADETAPPAKA